MGKKKAFFLNDLQDYWLFNELIGIGDDIFYNTTPKVTSPHHLVSRLSQLKPVPPNLISWREIKQDFAAILDNYDSFITKECHPFSGTSVSRDVRKSPSPVREKTFSVGWLGESASHWAHKDYLYNIRDKFLYHFVEPQLVPIYEKCGFTENIIGDSPKYYFLNSLNRKKACQLLGLDYTKQYMTILVTKFHDYTSNEEKILDHIIRYCNDNDIGIIFKTKMKYHDFYQSNIKHQYFFSGDCWMFHQTLALMMISNFVVGFSTAASLEAEFMGVPFINFWKIEEHDTEFPVDIQDLEFIQNNFHLICAKTRCRNIAYRLAFSKNIFNIKKSDAYEYDTIKDSLQNFLESAEEPIQVRKFDVHPLWRQIY